ncbi:MAG: radical SAM protein [Candidatus Ranarchaeia archaeon]
MNRDRTNIKDNKTLESWLEKPPSPSDPDKDLSTRKIVIKYIPCRNALTPSRLTGVSHAINPYVGCLHGCVYCYATYMSKHHSGDEPWGQFLDIKHNIVQRLRSEIRRLHVPRIGNIHVLLSSVTDLFQPIPSTRIVSAQIIETLIDNRVPFTILTKSADVTDLNKRLAESPAAEVGITITTLDKHQRQILEPYASSSQARLLALEKLSNHGVRTYGFIGPVFPGVSLTELKDLIRAVAMTGVSYLIIDNWHDHPLSWPMLRKNIRDLRQEIRDAIIEAHIQKQQEKQFITRNNRIGKEIQQLSKELALPILIADSPV